MLKSLAVTVNLHVFYDALFLSFYLLEIFLFHSLLLSLIYTLNCMCFIIYRKSKVT